MEQRNIIPFKVIELQVDNKELANRATQDRYSPERFADTGVLRYLDHGILWLYAVTGV